MRAKICFLSSKHGAADKRVVDKEAATLVRHGFEVFHVCPDTEARKYVYKGIQVVTFKRTKGLWNRVRHLPNLYRLAVKTGANVIHCNEVDSWIVGVCLKVFRKTQCIFDVHEHYPSTFAQSRFPKYLQPIMAGMIRGVFRLLTPFTDHIVLAKQTVSADFHTAEGKKLLVRNFTLLNGVEFATRRQLLAVNDPQVVASDQVTLVHLGLLSKIRGWPQLLTAMSQMRNKNVYLDIIGEFGDGSRPEFEHRAVELGLEGRVRVYDWMPFEEAFDRLCQAHIGLIAFQPGILNHVYAMPHKMFDYMAAGLAVVCPNFAVEVAPIVIETGCGVLVDPADPEALAAVLDDLVDSPETIKHMGQRGQQAVRDRYNWEAEAKALVAMYSSC